MGIKVLKKKERKLFRRLLVDRRGEDGEWRKQLREVMLSAGSAGNGVDGGILDAPVYLCGKLK